MNERLDRGVQYSLQGWIPVNEAVLSDIQARLADGRYKNDTSLLMRDLRKDPSLLLFAFRKISERPNAKPFAPHAISSAEDFEVLQSAIESASTFVSNHRFSTASLDQSHCMIRGVISSTVAEQLATQDGMPTGLAYSTAALRHLGHLLISWNYPHLYQKVLKNLGPDTSVDQAFAAILGFSPTLLAVTIVRKWGASPEIRAALGDSSTTMDLTPEIAKRGKDLEQICKVGEALARSMYPNEFPTAQADWHEASDFIRKKLGRDGLSAVLHATKLYVKSYASAAPASFTIPETLEREPVQGKPVLEATKRNRYLENCSPKTRQALDQVYDILNLNGVSRAPLELLIKRAIPLAGFVRGCLFLLDPDSLVLQPRVTIGDVAINKISSHLYSSTLSDGSRSAIAAALTSVVPQEITCSVIDGSAQDAIAGTLGVEHKSGVLYLEAGEELSTKPAQERLLLFKALRQTVNDVLHLE